MHLDFKNTYADLPEVFYQASIPEQVPDPYVVKINHPLAEQIGFDPSAFNSTTLAELFSGNKLLEGSRPIAQAYAGHQFGGLSPQLGDGRAILLGEIKPQASTSPEVQLLDIQLKGSGRTAFSRSGDGKATLYSVLREYLISEAMFALGIPTTRSLAVIGSGEKIVRDNKKVPGAILTRVAASHIRVGTFQYFAIRGDLDSVKQLADYTIERHYPKAKLAANPYLALLEQVIDKQIHLITQWMRVGFIHGVMNTDNMTVSGETIDYGPCAFLDNYNPSAKFSSIDAHGRYAFANQASIGYWNLTRFAETLVSLVDSDTDKSLELLTQTLEAYPQTFQATLLEVMRQKLGLASSMQETALQEDQRLVNEFLDILHQDEMDYTLAFRFLAQAVASDLHNDPLLDQVKNKERYQQWRSAWWAQLHKDEFDPVSSSAQMNRVNPIYIPRNWHVEQALTAAAESGDFSLFHEMHAVLKTPYTKQDNYTKYATTPVPSTTAYKTYCGT